MVPLALVVLVWLAACGPAMAEWPCGNGRCGLHGTAHVDGCVYGPPRNEVYSSPYLWAPSYSMAYTYGVLVAPGYPAHSPTLPAYTWFYGPISPSPAIW